MISYPGCVRTLSARIALTQLIRREGGVATLTVRQTDTSDDSDMSRLVGILALQRGVKRVVFERMTFPRFQAQLIVAYMSRYAHVDVEFVVCSFPNYHSYNGTVLHRCRAIKFTNCILSPSDFGDFTSTIAAQDVCVRMTRVRRCLGDTFLLCGGSV